MTDETPPERGGRRSDADDGTTGGHSRRGLLGLLGAGAVVSTAGCLGSAGDAVSRATRPRDRSADVSGSVLALDGSPVADATVTALGGDSRGETVVRSDRRGRFRLSSDGPVWLRVSAPGYVARSVAVQPGTPETVRLSPDEQTVSLTLGGDVMFGRRFYDSTAHPLSSRFRIDADDRLASHRELLRGIAPPLETADIASVNLETALTTTDWRHPSKKYSYTSHPVAARALADAGVEYVTLGNNHVFDALEPGFDQTTTALDAAGVRHSGAGYSAAEAWEPAYVDRNGVRVAFVSCCTVVGDGLALDWSADRDTRRAYTVEQDGRRTTFPGGMGVAEPTVDRLRSRVKRAADESDVVVVQIHGGKEYQRRPVERIRRLTVAASESSADIVVNHHPHVTGGIEFHGGTLVAWTMGNLVFDQELWSTLRSYVLTVDVDPRGVVRTSVEPVVLDGYVPRGATGEPKRAILRETAGLSTDDFSFAPSRLESVPRITRKSRSKTVTFEGEPATYRMNAGWVDDVDEVSGSVRLGESRLPTGRFAPTLVGDSPSHGALWRYGRGTSPDVGSGLGVDLSGGVRLSRHGDNTDPDLITPIHRLPVRTGSFTLAGTYQYNDTEGAELLVTWYDDTAGESFAEERYELGNTDQGWKRFSHRLEAPRRATHVNFFLFLQPPSRPIVREVALDDVQFVEWADRSVTGGRRYDHLLVDGRATARLAVDGSGEEDPLWERT